jgi:Uncharacterized protein conserved in bacteria (DUF2325)
MRIGWIGGVERYEVQLERLAKAAGHELEYHRGDVRGRGAQTLEGLVERCQLIVIVTETNSHGAVQLARKLARQRGRGTLLLRKSGIARFSRLLEAIDQATAQGLFHADGSMGAGYEAALLSA